MKNKLIVISIVTGVLAILATAAIVVFTRQSAPSTTEGTTHPGVTDTGSDSSRSETYQQYAALKGEEYDKAFISNMIIHHEGAINMAELALAKAKHQELKDMASSIVSSQSKEVADMKHAQETWGYPVSSGHGMHGGSGNTMQQDMASMGMELQELAGDAFDRRFLELMIEHHQQAIDMAKPADTNAQHSKVKDMAKTIIATQAKEIETMKQWQKEWWR